MGCASSKQSKCKHCQRAYSPLTRSSSVPVHHTAKSKGDSYHVVALTSSTLGLSKLSSLEQARYDANGHNDHHDSETTTITNNDIEVIQAKSWSNMINEKIPKVIPKTPNRTPPGEPETINTWELMDGLEDVSPLRLPKLVDRSFSFHAVSRSSPFDQPVSKLQENSIESPGFDHPKLELPNSVGPPIGLDEPQSELQENGIESSSPDQPDSQVQEHGSGRPILDEPESQLHENDDGQVALDLPESNLEENSNAQPALDESESESESEFQENGNGSPKPEWMQKAGSTDSNLNSDSTVSDFDPEIISTFRKALEEISPIHPVYLQSPEKEKATIPSNNHFLPNEFKENNKVSNVFNPMKCPPHGEGKVVIYFTSLRGVRKTYEDCCHVRVILKGFGVRLDERDVSMHYGFREELNEILGVGFRGGLPKVFVKGQFIGGAEEIRQLHEDGDLEKVVAGCAMVEDGICEMCSDVRFMPCDRCSGSCKIYCEDENEWEGEDGGGEFQRCPDCNENGLLRCPACCY